MQCASRLRGSVIFLTIDSRCFKIYKFSCDRFEEEMAAGRIQESDLFHSDDSHHTDQSASVPRLIDQQRTSTDLLSKDVQLLADQLDKAQIFSNQSKHIPPEFDGQARTEQNGMEKCQVIVASVPTGAPGIVECLQFSHSAPLASHSTT